MITTHNLTGGPTYTADPVSENYRLLLCAVLLQAWRDAKKKEARLSRPAQRWLCRRETVELAYSIGVRLPGMVRP